jgi:acyl-CoA dehydrogenase family protein 9
LQVGWEQTGGRWSLPDIPVHSGELSAPAKALARQIKQLGLALPWVFLRAASEEKFIQSQYVHERLADIAIDAYASACTLSRLDHLLGRSNGDARQGRAEVAAGRCFLALADRRMTRNFEALKDNDDPQTTAAADAAMDFFG